MSGAGPEAAAEWLATLWRRGAQAEALPEALRPATLEQGYDIQDRLVAALGERVAGWKLGVGSPKGRAQTGIDRSIAGRVLGSRCFGPGDTVPLPDTAPITVEFEIAYVLAREVRPEAPPPESLGALIAETRVTFELVRSRFRDRTAVGWPSFAADNAAFEALVVGEPIDPAHLDELAASLVVSVNGEERARAVSGGDFTDPEAALRGFLALARERGMVLPAGAIISTGTLSAPFAMQGAAEIRARYLGTELAFRTRPA